MEDKKNKRGRKSHISIKRENSVFRELLKKYDGDINNPDFLKELSKSKAQVTLGDSRNKNFSTAVFEDEIIDKFRTYVFKNKSKLKISKFSKHSKIIDSGNLYIEKIANKFKIEEEVVFSHLMDVVNNGKFGKKKKDILNAKAKELLTQNLSILKYLESSGLLLSHIDSAIKSFIDKIMNTSKTFSFQNLAFLTNSNSRELISIFKKFLVGKEKYLIRDFKESIKYLTAQTDVKSLIEEITKESSKANISLLYINELDLDFYVKELADIAKDLGIKEVVLTKRLEKIAQDKGLNKIQKKKFLFYSDFKVDGYTKKNDLMFLMIVYCFLNKYYLDTKSAYIYRTVTGDINDDVRLIFRDELKRLSEEKSDEGYCSKYKKIKRTKDDILDIIDEIFETKENSEVLLNSFVNLGIITMSYSYYLINTYGSKYKNEILEYLIAKHYRFEFDSSNSDCWDPIYHSFVSSYPDTISGEGEKYENNGIMKFSYFKDSCVRILTLIDSLTKIDRGVFIFKEDIADNVQKVKPFIEELNKKTKELKIYSLQRFYAENKVYLADELKIETAQEFYYLLDMEKNKEFYCVRYPTIASKEINEKLSSNKYISVGDCFMDLIEEENLSISEASEKYGIHSTSIKQFISEKKRKESKRS